MSSTSAFRAERQQDRNIQEHPIYQTWKARARERLLALAQALLFQPNLKYAKILHPLAGCCLAFDPVFPMRYHCIVVYNSTFYIQLLERQHSLPASRHRRICHLSRNGSSHTRTARGRAASPTGLLRILTCRDQVKRTYGSSRTGKCHLPVLTVTIPASYQFSTLCNLKWTFKPSRASMELTPLRLRPLLRSIPWPVRLTRPHSNDEGRYLTSSFNTLSPPTSSTCRLYHQKIGCSCNGWASISVRRTTGARC